MVNMHVIATLSFVMAYLIFQYGVNGLGFPFFGTDHTPPSHIILNRFFSNSFLGHRVRYIF